MRENDENVSFFSGILIEHDFLYVRGFEPEMRVCVCACVASGSAAYRQTRPFETLTRDARCAAAAAWRCGLQEDDR